VDDLIQYILIPIVTGASGLALKYLKDISENILQLKISVQVLTEKLTTLDAMAHDHEERLRNLERKS
jgi:hypothetical protein